MAVGHGGVGTQLWLFHRTALSNNSTWLFRAFQNKICTKSVFYTSFSSLIPLACFCNMVSTSALKIAKRMQLLSISRVFDISVFHLFISLLHRTYFSGGTGGSVKWGSNRQTAFYTHFPPFLEAYGCKFCKGQHCSENDTRIFVVA